MAQLSTRIHNVAPSATLEVDLKAKALKASGIDIIGFGAGEPDFPTPDYIVRTAVEAAQDSKVYQNFAKQLLTKPHAIAAMR